MSRRHCQYVLHLIGTPSAKYQTFRRSLESQGHQGGGGQIGPGTDRSKRIFVFVIELKGTN